MVSGSSPRLYIDCPNTDVEFSAEVFVENDLEITHLVARSNHEDRPGGFGGYYLYVNFKEQKMYFKKEETHVLGYSSRLRETDIIFEKGKWHKMKISMKNMLNGNVSIVGEFNGTVISVIDDGTLKGPPYTGEGKWAFIRTNKPNGVSYKNVLIQAI